MLLSVHVTSVLFLVQFNNFDWSTGLYWTYVHALTLDAHSYVFGGIYIQSSYIVHVC